MAQRMTAAPGGPVTLSSLTGIISFLDSVLQGHLVIHSSRICFPACETAGFPEGIPVLLPRSNEDSMSLGRWQPGRCLGHDLESRSHCPCRDACYLSLSPFCWHVYHLLGWHKLQWEQKSKAEIQFEQSLTWTGELHGEREEKENSQPKGWVWVIQSTAQPLNEKALFRNHLDFKFLQRRENTQLTFLL